MKPRRGKRKPTKSKHQRVDGTTGNQQSPKSINGDRTMRNHNESNAQEREQREDRRKRRRRWSPLAHSTEEAPHTETNRREVRRVGGVPHRGKGREEAQTTEVQDNKPSDMQKRTLKAGKQGRRRMQQSLLRGQERRHSH